MKKPIIPLFFGAAVCLIAFLNTACSLHLNQSDNPTTITPSPVVAAITKTTAATFTITPTQTKTILPVNTLTWQERENHVREFLSGETACELPCWLDITPGVTSWNEAEETLRYLGVRISDSPREDGAAIFHGTGGFEFVEKRIYNLFDFVERAGNVDFIVIQSHGYHNPEEFQSLWKDYSPDSFLKTYGIPDRVLLQVISRGYSIYRGYFLWLFYDYFGIMIRYGGSVLDSPTLHICPKIGLGEDGIEIINLSLRSLDSPLLLESFDPILNDTNHSTASMRIVRSIQDATGMNVTEFYNVFMQNSPACFDTRQDIWDVKWVPTPTAIP